MRVRSLSLRYFRNYDRLDWAPSARLTVLWGDNAQGKSNLLEALFYLATTRSFRASSDRELLGWSGSADPIGFTRIGAQVERGADRLGLEVILREEARGEAGATALTKRIKLNDLPRRGIDVIGALTAVLFSPQDLALVEGAPHLRRRYLDVTISQADRQYCRYLAHYNRVMVQRNHLLRTIRDRGAPSDQLRFWDRELVAAGSQIVVQRLRTIDRLRAVAQQTYDDLADSRDQLTIGYKSSVLKDGVAAVPPAEEVASRFTARLTELQPREVALGSSLVGPHRDDLTFALDGHDLGTFGSRGQQRTLALALKLAETAHLRALTGELPVLLLDDVFSELDPGRRERVFASILPDQQVVFTTTDRHALDGAPADASWVRVQRGRLEPVAGADLVPLAP